MVSISGTGPTADRNGPLSVVSYGHKVFLSESDFPENDKNVASQSSYTKVFASGGRFQDVFGELIRVGQNRSVQRPPLSLTFCAVRFGCP